MTTDPNAPNSGPNPALLARQHTKLARVARRLPQPTVELLAREIITRLGNRNGPLPQADPTASTDAKPEMVERLAEALIGDDDVEATRMVFDLFDRDIPLEAVYLDHLAPAARLLGEWWSEDRTPFTDVTIGTGRIYAIMRTFRTHAAQHPEDRARAAIFAPVPGEAHTLGVTMAADLFRERGWSVQLLLGHNHDVLVEKLAEDRSPVIGLSCSGAKTMEPLARLIVALRIARPTAHILVGGAAMYGFASRVRLTDPDSTITDMQSAKLLLEKLEARFPAR